LSLPLTLDYVLLQHTLQSTPRIPNIKKSEQDCFQYQMIRAHLCHEISDQKRKNNEKSSASAVSSHPSSTPHGTANLFCQLHLSANCLLASSYCKDRNSTRLCFTYADHRTSFHINYIQNFSSYLGRKEFL